MMVWAGCMTCRTDPTGRKWIGFWVSEKRFWDVTTADVHGGPGYEDHKLHAFTLLDFGVPDEQPESDVRWQASYAEALADADHLAPMATLAAWLGKAIWDVDYQDFRSLYAGQYAGKVTRALRKRYLTSPAGEGHHYLWRRF